MADFKIVRENVVDNDASNPVTEQSLINSRGVHRAIIDIKITGSDSPSFDVSPIFWDDKQEQYFNGQTRTIRQDDSFILDIGASDGFYFRCDNKQGTNPSITITYRNLA